MFKKILYFASLGLYALIYLNGCSLVTPAPPDKIRPVGNDLVINEVFSLPPDRYYAYSWIELYNPTDHSIPWYDDVYPASLNVIGENGTMAVTENDGSPWTTVPNVPAVKFNAIDFPYPDTGYAVGDGGVFYRVVRVNGVYEFFPATTPPPSSVNFNTVSSIPLTVSGFIGGDGGQVFRTINRGQTWSLQNTGTTKNIRALKMISVSLIYACGDSGLIMISPRSGQWNQATIGEAYQTTSFKTIGVKIDTAWVAGEGGAVLVSRNVGQTWLPETTNTSATLRGSFFTREFDRAWIVGDSGTILYKEGFGGTWEKQESGTTGSLQSVTFVDRRRGWIVGENGLILTTTNGGRRWTVQQSGTTNTLTAIFPLPLNIRILNRYVLQMWALRKEFFLDVTTGSINFDYIVRQDTGFLYFDPQILVEQAGFDPLDPIPVNGFVVINSDSSRFEEHTDIGPGKTEVLNFSIGYYLDTTIIGSGMMIRGVPVLWDLLQAGEIRLIKQYFKLRVSTGEFLGFTTETVDVVRYGGFTPSAGAFPPEEMYPQNEPAGFIPEWWSLARYGDDVGVPVDQSNTRNSFFMADKPVPGWYSQINKGN